MKEKQMLVVIKEPGKEAYVEPLFDNTLEAFQTAVGGYSETLTVCSDLCLVVNEEGAINGMPFNTEICGHKIHGTIVACGVDGDEFVSLKASAVPFALRTLGGQGK